VAQQWDTDIKIKICWVDNRLCLMMTFVSIAGLSNGLFDASDLRGVVLYVISWVTIDNLLYVAC